MSNYNAEKKKIVIVGAGCFGISSALHLLKRGFNDITILDKADTLPAPDAASTDINKVVRSSYSDKFYARFAREAIALWKDESEWGNTYHESGVLVLGNSDIVYENDIVSGARVKKFENASEINAIGASDVTFGNLFGRSQSYFNADGGWAESGKAVAHAIEKVKASGVKVLSGKKVEKFMKKDDFVRVVQCDDGSSYEAEIAILATGSWSPSSFPSLNLKDKCVATGQSIAGIQLTEEERRIYASCPVVLDFGHPHFYTFPPDVNGILKLTRHAAGYQNFIANSSGISTPRTVTSHGNEGLMIPKEEGILLRECLREVYPNLSERPFEFTRLCWFTDTPDSNWIIDYHPSDPSLIIATGGSGHAFKFFPNIGGLVADLIDGSLSSELRHKFAFDRIREHTDTRQDEIPKILNIDDLLSHEAF